MFSSITQEDFLKWSLASRWTQGCIRLLGYSLQNMCRLPASPSRYCFPWSPQTGWSTVGASPTDMFMITAFPQQIYTHTYPNTPGIFLHIFIHRPIWSLKVKKDISMNKLKAAWLPEIQSSWWHHRCMVGYHYLKGCAEKRPTEASPLDCNAPPEWNRTALDGHRHLIYIYIFFFITWWGSGAIFFLNRWNTLLSSVSCIAISSRSVSARAAGKKKKIIIKL